MLLVRRCEPEQVQQTPCFEVSRHATLPRRSGWPAVFTGSKPSSVAESGGAAVRRKQQGGEGRDETAVREEEERENKAAGGKDGAEGWGVVSGKGGGSSRRTRAMSVSTDRSTLARRSLIRGWGKRGECARMGF